MHLPKLSFKASPALPSMGTNDNAKVAGADARKRESGRMNGFADNVRVELAGLIAYEMEVSVQVGVMLSAGISTTQICHSLGIDTIELKMCKRRLQQIAQGWVDE